MRNLLIKAVFLVLLVFSCAAMNDKAFASKGFETPENDVNIMLSDIDKKEEEQLQNSFAIRYCAPRFTDRFFSDSKLIEYITSKTDDFQEILPVRILLKLDDNPYINDRILRLYLPNSSDLRRVFLRKFDMYYVCNIEENYVDVIFKFYYSTGAKVMRAFKAENSDEKIELNPKEIELKQSVEKIINELNLMDKPKHEIAKIVHDYIILNTNYSDDTPNDEDDPHDAYNIIVNGSGVCQAYSELYYIILNAANVECSYIVGKLGTQENDINHSWNRVKLDDESWYNVDVTSDDPIPDRKGRVKYDYFCLTDEQLKLTHIWKEDEIKCVSLNYAYNDIKQLP